MSDDKELAPRWWASDERRAIAEGWMLATNDRFTIHRHPEMTIFASPDALIEHLQTRANHGDLFAARALNVHYMDIDVQPLRSVMCYVATVHLVLPHDTKNETEACDVISDVMGNLIEEGLFADWGYARYGGHWLHPTRIPVNNPDHPDFPGTMLRYENDAL